jgi:hypothetical protein
MLEITFVQMFELYELLQNELKLYDQGEEVKSSTINGNFNRETGFSIAAFHPN